MKTTFLVLFSIFFVYAVVSQSGAYEFHWEIDETPEGQESATVVEPVQVTLLDQPMEVVSHSASIRLPPSIFCSPRTRVGIRIRP